MIPFTADLTNIKETERNVVFLSAFQVDQCEGHLTTGHIGHKWPTLIYTCTILTKRQRHTNSQALILASMLMLTHSLGGTRATKYLFPAFFLWISLPHTS